MRVRYAVPVAQLVLFVGVGLALPLLPGTNFSLLITLLIFIGLATSWDILGGWTGQTSLGHAAFVGIGAYALALGTNRLGLDAISAVQLGMGVAALFALLWGSITFGLRGSYFTLSTIAIAEILRLVAIDEGWFTGGSAGLFISALPEPFGLDLFDRQVEYYLALLYATGVLACVTWFSGSHFGYTVRAVREDEAAAQASGIDPVRIKLRAFALSGALTALGGGIYGAYLSFLDPHNLFFLPLSVQIALTAIIGGRGTVWGPALGATLLILAAEVFRSVFAEANLLIYGLLILIITLFVPRGLLGGLERYLLRRRYVRDQQ